ncbi:hypothetical protein [Agrococcus sp. HG114]|uniref:hypothetical protein n=1 Tax=Agrococcus sp. HG114 TaxID=2969757 RepID=UPI00215A3783|nr:hypothetical protein [Agrococcus sp. HG114]MCR8671037.1 hypothetical protein [Agrococcus sp. HG114]
MGILDDAKGRLGGAAEWVKDKAEHLGEHTQSAGHTIGEKAAEARSWVGGIAGGRAAGGGAPSPEHRTAAGAAGHDDVERTGGGGDLAAEWVDVTTDPAAGGAHADDTPPDGPQNPL